MGEDVLEGVFGCDITDDFWKGIGAGMKVEGDEVARSALCDALFYFFDRLKSLLEGFDMSYIGDDDVGAFYVMNVCCIDEHLFQAVDVGTEFGGDGEFRV